MCFAVGAVLLALPRYSPDLNPIEKVWAMMKQFLRSKGGYLGNDDDQMLMLDAFDYVTAEMDHLANFRSCCWVVTSHGELDPFSLLDADLS